MVPTSGKVRRMTVIHEPATNTAPDGDGKYPIRSVNTIDPLKGADNKDLSCGPGSYPISGDESKVYAKASPGSAIDVNWMSGDGQAWPHNVGPMLTYLAQCDGGDCSTLDGKDAKWFKIEQTGLKDDGSGWVQEELSEWRRTNQ